MLAPWKGSYDKPRQCIKKQRYHFADKGLYSQSYGSSSSHLWTKSWTIKSLSTEKLMLSNCGVGEELRVPWTARISNHSIQKEMKLEYSLKGLILKLKLQYFGYLMRRADSLEKTLMLGKIKGRRRG